MKINIPQDRKNALGSWYPGILFLLKMDKWIFLENEHEKIVLQQATAKVNFSSNSILFSNLGD